MCLRSCARGSQLSCVDGSTMSVQPKKLQGMEEYLDKPLEKVLKGACIYGMAINKHAKICWEECY